MSLTAEMGSTAQLRERIADYQQECLHQENEIQQLREQLEAVTRERDEYKESHSTRNFRVVELVEQLEAVTRERDAIKGALGCEDCKFFLARDANALTDPDVSEAAFKAVFHDVKEIQQWKTRKELEAECESLRADAERYRWLRHGDNDERVLVFTNPALCSIDTVFMFRTEELDEVIDAAMQKEKEE